MISRRLFLLWCAAFGLFQSRRCLQAATESDEDFVCLLCKTKFSATLDSSGTTSGRRLDLKPLGSIRAPWRLPVCPKCRFVQYQDANKFSQEELKALREFVFSAAYARLSPEETSHFLLGKIYEHLKRPSIEVAHTYLAASWQVDRDAKRHQAYLKHSLEQFTIYLTGTPPKDEAWKTARFVQGELLRQLQRFDEAQRHFRAMEKEEHFKAKPFPQLLSYELELIEKKDPSLREMPRLNR